MNGIYVYINVFLSEKVAYLTAQRPGSHFYCADPQAKWTLYNESFSSYKHVKCNLQDYFKKFSFNA
jgi:hypothetical protein